MTFRTLRADEIDLRVGGVYPSGITLLCYKDARCDMNILDETVGAENWQRDHFEVKGVMFCRVGIRVDEGWTFKANYGLQLREKQKGESSDSFKQACVCWGIGRELYTAPNIFIPLGKDMYEAPSKLTTAAQKMVNRFRVDTIEYDAQRRVTKLVIVDGDGTVVWQTKEAKGGKK